MLKKRKINIQQNLEKTLNVSLIDTIKNKFEKCNDIKIQQVNNVNNSLTIHYVYVNNLVNVSIIDENIIKPLMNKFDVAKTEQELKQYIIGGGIYHIDIQQEMNINKIVFQILQGNFIIIISDVAFVFDAKNYDKRSVSEASNEVSVKGARDAFIEVATTNISLVRQRSKNDHLKCLIYEVGNVAKSKIAIMYIDDLVNENILSKVIDKIANMDISALSSPEMFEENLTGHKKSLFPTLVYTERPDKFVANVVEGKIGVLVDGFPTGYLMPCTLSMLMQDSEEYTTNYFIGTFIRVLRYISLIMTLITPAFYIAITVFHNEMIPKKLTVSIARSKQDVPFPVFIEVIILLIAFEMLLEAGMRLPKNIGQTISILGGLIVGEAAINAKFVSPAVVVIVATTGITSFLIPNQDLTNALRITRLMMVLMASMAGLFGITIGIIAIIYYLASLESFGVPYLKPFVNNGRTNTWYETVVRPNLHRKKDVRW